MRATAKDMEAYIAQVNVMIKTSEKISNAENYITSLYANEKISSNQFQMLCDMVYGN